MSKGTDRIRYAFGGACPRAGRPDDAADDLPLWLTGYPATSRQTDVWVLVCGGLAAVATFAAAFFASAGTGAASVTPGTTAPAVVRPACPSPSASR